ncbi:porin, OprB family [Pseudovibrio ascidiaceicola]|uniref:Porin, OprB family n=2 Tax=Pseudovibrio ascidiaceicola TaxID=285279 RepID=A0A1I3Y342_9HYPH|nr:porin, OprB family [Pseudovibrio ascidiaceicola]
MRASVAPISLASLMKQGRLLLACLCFCAVFNSIAQAQNSRWPLNWGDWETATGDWGGYRTKLNDMGIDPELNYTHDIMANPVGGERQSAAYAGALDASIDFDLQKLLGLNGTSFSFGLYQGLGRDLSGEDINNVFDVAQIFIGDVFGISQMNILQRLANDRVEIAIGRLSTGTDFAYSDAFPLYVNSGVNGNPVQLLENLPSFTTPPFSQWGVRGTLKPQESLYLSVGAYNADLNAQDNDSQGLNFKFNPEDGVLVIAEGGALVGQEKTSAYLPGRYMLGGYYDTSDYTPFTDANATEEGNWGLYFIANQMVYEEQADQGLNLWGLFTFAPQQSINSLPYGVSGGAYYKGLLDSRDNDITAGAFYLGFFSDDLPGQTFELVFEINHRFQFTEWFYTTVDGQYVVNPNGQTNISDAWVVGFEMSVDF